MIVLDRVLGRPLATLEADHQHIGPGAGIPVLGLDALASAAHGPEAALTLLIPLGAIGVAYSLPIICTILVIVYLSYRQTIAAYPGSGGSYTVAGSAVRSPRSSRWRCPIASIRSSFSRPAAGAR